MLAILALASMTGCGSSETGETQRARATEETVEVGKNVGEDAPFLYTQREDGTYEARAMVLENADHGPLICTGGSTDSIPPLCNGVEVENWSWESVEGEMSDSGTTWGTFHFVGDVVDGKFSLTGFLE